MRGIRWMACGPLKALSNLRKLKKHMLQYFIDIDNDGGVRNVSGASQPRAGHESNHDKCGRASCVRACVCVGKRERNIARGEADMASPSPVSGHRMIAIARTAYTSRQIGKCNQATAND